MNFSGINKHLIEEDWERLTDNIYLLEEEERYKLDVKSWIEEEEATIISMDLNGNEHEIKKTGEPIQNRI